MDQIVAELERKLAQLNARYLAAHMRVIASMGNYDAFRVAQAAFDAARMDIVITTAHLAEARREAAIQAALEAEAMQADACICYGLDHTGYCPACAKNREVEIPY